MNEQRARKILGDAVQSDDSLYCLSRYIHWSRSDDEATLDDRFKAVELEAIAWWMRNK